MSSEAELRLLATTAQLTVAVQTFHFIMATSDASIWITKWAKVSQIPERSPSGSRFSVWQMVSDHLLILLHSLIL